MPLPVKATREPLAQLGDWMQWRGEKIVGKRPNVQLDFMRCICVTGVLYHHIGLEFDNPNGGRYALSAPIWCLWYLVALTSYLYATGSSNNLLATLFASPKSYLALTLIGCLFNFLGVLASGGRRELNIGAVIYQMYYLIFCGMLHVVFAPIRLIMQGRRGLSFKCSCKRDAKLNRPKIHFGWCVLSGLLFLSVLVMPFAGQLFKPGHGDPGKDDKTACQMLMSGITSMMLVYGGLGGILMKARPKVVLILSVLSVIGYLVFMSWSSCRNHGVDGRLMRFVVWYSYAFVWGAAKKAALEEPASTVGRAIEHFAACFRTFWWLLFPIMEMGAVELMNYPEHDIRYVTSETWHDSQYLNTLIGVKDTWTFVLFMGVTTIDTPDVYRLASPVQIWTVLAFLSHQAVLYAVPSVAFSELAAVGYIFGPLFIYVAAHKTVAGMCRKRKRSAGVAPAASSEPDRSAAGGSEASAVIADASAGGNVARAGVGVPSAPIPSHGLPKELRALPALRLAPLRATAVLPAGRTAEQVFQQLDKDGNGILGLEELEHGLADPATRRLAAELLKTHRTALMLPGGADGVDYYEFQRVWGLVHKAEEQNPPEVDATTAYYKEQMVAKEEKIVELQELLSKLTSRPDSFPSYSSSGSGS